ncbi:MAG: pyridoxine/pyridoxamine 5'-phosphate oxidase [Ignavibacteriaceae bacterium]|nr:MAG: pyridoxine/pyridoxamine 5'-phosphate oxidase [Ignavibacteriaceae bacterium]
MAGNRNEIVASLRRNYQAATLDISDVTSDPLKQFEIWFKNALDSDLIEPNAMILSTVSAEMVPSARTVLLKGFDSEGFTFFTNYDSQKGREIEANPNVSLLFLWLELERQVRINGKATRIPEAESYTYFRSRPADSRIGAWASRQSTTVPGRTYLEAKFAEYKKKFGDTEIPLPPFWGGYKVIPERIEFWQGRPNRLHDRILYTKNENGWKIERLSP